MITYKCFELEGDGRIRQAAIPGFREGLRVVGAEMKEDKLVLHVLLPNAVDRRYVYVAGQKDQVPAFDSTTELYAEIVEPGRRLNSLDACDFVTLLEIDGVYKAIFASVRK